MLFAGNAFSQIEIKHFNAGWNKTNDVPWFMDLKDCETKGYVDISKDKEKKPKKNNSNGKCSSCDHKNDHSDSYCSSCGAKL